MSAVESYREPRRSETEIAADAVWALFIIGLIARTPDNIKLAAKASGLSLQALRDADFRHQNGRAHAPAPAPASSTVPPPLATVTAIDKPRKPRAPYTPRPLIKKDCPFCDTTGIVVGKPWVNHQARFHPGEWEKVIEAEMTAKYGPECPDCGEPIMITVTVEHHCCSDSAGDADG